jgi:hypothetical protein
VDLWKCCASRWKFLGSEDLGAQSKTSENLNFHLYAHFLFMTSTLIKVMDLVKPAIKDGAYINPFSTWTGLLLLKSLYNYARLCIEF